MFKTTLPSALLALAAIAAPAHAFVRADANAAPQRVVDASDLDLSTADGRATFDRRIDVAVKMVCAEDESSGLAGRNAVRACRSHARETLVTQREAVIVAAAAARAHALLAKN